MQASIYLVEDHQRRLESPGLSAVTPTDGSDGKDQLDSDAVGHSLAALRVALAALQEEMRRLRHSVDNLSS